MIPSVNFHLWQPCNMRCRFCYATFQDVKRSILPKGHLPRGQAIEVVRHLAAHGFQKITFAGGEPTLCPWLPDLIGTAKEAGMTTMIVTNGSRLS
ncbi:MAG TPA: radical SAM protein, partial [Flavobacteriales bacterium]|nr:radical SAM protein [Flavobacteriales bacterium]